MMDWNDLRIFLTIAREGTLGAAARTLRGSQPTMGRRLRALEVSLGQTLFQRTSVGMVLTDEGTAILRHAERMEDEALGLRRNLAGQDGQLEGALRLTSSDWFGSHILVPILAEFAETHPRVTVELLTDSRIYSLARREADLAFRITPFDESDVISRRLMRIHYAAFQKVGMVHPQVGDGAGTRLITMDTAFGGMPDATWLKKLLPNAVLAARSNNRDVQAQLCLGGVGLAVLPQSLGDSIVGLERVDLGSAPPSRETWVGYHQDLKRLGRLRALLDLAIRRLAN